MLDSSLRYVSSFPVSRSTQLIALIDRLGLGTRGFIVSIIAASRFLILATSVYYAFLSPPVCSSSPNPHSPNPHSPYLFESYTLYTLLLLEMDITVDVVLNHA